MADEPVFELLSGSVRFGRDIVLDRVDFLLERGEFLALLGANGSGKTTLVRALLGLTPLSAGAARIFGGPISAFREWHRVGYVPQRSAAAVGAVASVAEVVLSGRVAGRRRVQRYGPADHRAARDAMELVGLEERCEEAMSSLSGGQQQRALIARALAGEPQVLVLDEPLSGVDVQHQHALASVLRDFNSEGGTVLLVAHGLGVMEDLVTREVDMAGGRVVYDGPHHPSHVHSEHVHHPENEVIHSPLDRAAGGS